MANQHGDGAPEISGFQFVRRLGGGSFADVYQYSQAYTNRLVAVKVLRAALESAEDAATFDAEVNALAELSTHPCIVTLYSAGQTEERRPYLVMEHVALRSLDDVKGSDEVLSLTDRLRIMVMVCGAVETAHQRGIVHGDIKPHNILVTEYLTPKLADFGIATSRHHRRSQQAYSVPWAAPELLESDVEANVATDVYALGSTFYTVLAGHAPFVVPGESNRSGDIVLRARSGHVPLLSTAQAPEPLARVLHRALSAHPGDRPGSAKALGEELQAVERRLGLAPTSLHLMPATEERLASPPRRDAARPDPSGGDVTRRRPARAAGPVPGSDTHDTTVRRPVGGTHEEAGGVGSWFRTVEPSPSPPVAGRTPPDAKLPASRPETRRRGPVLAAVSAIGLAVLIGALLVLSPWSGEDPTSTGATATDSGQDAARSDRDRRRARTGTETGRLTTPSPSPLTTPVTPSPPVTTTWACWDGTPVATPQACTTEPQGVAGLQWVFPEMPLEDCQPDPVPSSNHVQNYVCTTQLPTGASVGLEFTQWRNNSLAETSFDGVVGGRRTLSDITGTPFRYRWMSSTDLEEVTSATLYIQAPWSVTTYTASDADRTAAIAAFGVMRKFEYLRGGPTALS